MAWASGRERPPGSWQNTSNNTSVNASQAEDDVCHNRSANVQTCPPKSRGFQLALRHWIQQCSRSHTSMWVNMHAVYSISFWPAISWAFTCERGARRGRFESEVQMNCILSYFCESCTCTAVLCIMHRWTMYNFVKLFAFDFNQVFRRFFVTKAPNWEFASAVAAAFRHSCLWNTLWVVTSPHWLHWATRFLNCSIVKPGHVHPSNMSSNSVALGGAFRTLILVNRSSRLTIEDGVRGGEWSHTIHLLPVSSLTDVDWLWERGAAVTHCKKISIGT